MPRLAKAIASLGLNRIASLKSAMARSFSPFLIYSFVLAFSHISETPAAKGVSVVGIQSDRLTVIRKGSVVIPSFRINDATVGKGRNVFRIESNGFIEIRNGSVVVTFFRISDTP